MATTKSIILITGANGGIGFELASQLLADSTKYVLLGSRSAEKGEAAIKDLQSRNLPGTVSLLQIDVSNPESINAAAKKVESQHGRLDALVNNAAIGFVQSDDVSKCMADTFATNAIGPLLTINTFMPLLSKSTGTPRILNVSSGAGSIGRLRDPAIPRRPIPGSEPYRTSKAALNMLTVMHHNDFESKGWKVFAYCPGFTVSGLSHMNKAENGAKPTSEGARPMVDILNGKRDGDSGNFVHDEDEFYPW